MDEAIPSEPSADDERDTADALQFLLASPPRPERRDPRPPVLEVYHLWGNAVLDARRFPDSSRPIVLGARTGHRWRFLGVDMGWVPSPLSKVLPAVAPGWSDVSTDWQSDFVVPPAELPDEEEWPLFVPGEAGHVARIAAGWTGFATVGGERRSFEELVAAGRATATPGGGYAVAMAPDLRLVVEACGARFVAQMGPSTAAITARPEDEIEPGFLGLVGFGGFLFALVVVLARLNPPDATTEVDDMPDRIVELLLDRPAPAPKVTVAEGSQRRGEKAKGPEGKVGRREAEKKVASGERREIDQQELDRKVAESAGVLGVETDDGIDRTFGPAGLAELKEGIGGVIGERGVQIGSNGLARRGDGFGGDGEAEGLGGLSTLPGGDGRGEWGEEGGDLGDKDDGAIAGPEGEPVVLGCIKPELIREVVHQQLSTIRYCYQRELQKDPTLRGGLVVKFSIARDGTVSSADVKSSTLGNSAVESCVTGRFMRMQFPEPCGTGTVIVSYPFQFSTGR